MKLLKQHTPGAKGNDMKDITEITIEHREELDQLLEQRRAAEDDAAEKHGIDINAFGSLLDPRISDDEQVVAIQAKIDAIYGRK